MVRVSDFYIIIIIINFWRQLKGKTLNFTRTKKEKQRKKTRWKQKKKTKKRDANCCENWEGKKSTDAPRQAYSWIDSLWFIIRGNRWGSSDSPKKSTDSVKTKKTTNSPTNHEIPRTNERTNQPNLKGQSPCLPDVGLDEGILRCGSPGSTKFP
jgi:cell shape-determining protein MreC